MAPSTGGVVVFETDYKFWLFLYAYAVCGIDGVPYIVVAAGCRHVFASKQSVGQKIQRGPYVFILRQ